MSGIYIKNQSLPAEGECYFLQIFHDGTVYDAVGRRMACTAVPVPPHGRRVVYRGDVYNAIEAKRIKTLDRVLNDRYIEGMHDGLKQALFTLATVEDAPTIIQAEEGET